MDLEFNKNEDINKQLAYEVHAFARLKKIYAGGGEKAAARQKDPFERMLIEKEKCWPENGWHT